MSRARKGRRARSATGNPAASVLTLGDRSTLKVAQRRLGRANDVLNAILFCAEAGAELSLGSLAIAARDLIDRVLDDLARLSGASEERP